LPRAEQAEGRSYDALGNPSGRTLAGIFDYGLSTMGGRVTAGHIR